MKQQAAALAKEPYRAPTELPAAILDAITYEEWGKIHFDPDSALYANAPERFPVSFFHPGKFFRKPVEVNVVAGASARTILYDQSYFVMPAESPARQLAQGSGFGGLRFQEAKDGRYDWRGNDWAAFLGASYFRAIGALHQYGLSARAIALDTWQAGRSEEFPDFTKFWIGPEEGNSVTLHALLEGPGITGACRFVMTRETGVVMDIDQVFHLRRDYIRFGLAPLTSMYWFSETRKAEGVDWRPEVHDSDGLAMWTGKGEHVWRPLNNPGGVTVSAFNDENPRGFGLLQRDRDFDHYGDGVFYDRRPSVWVGAEGRLGARGDPARRDPHRRRDSRQCRHPVDARIAGRGGQHGGVVVQAALARRRALSEPVGALRRHAAGQWRRARPAAPQGRAQIHGRISRRPARKPAEGVLPEAILWASRGSFSYIFTEPVPDEVPGHWRAQFDLSVEDDEAVEMRLFLKTGATTLSETWLYQYHPF